MDLLREHLKGHVTDAYDYLYAKQPSNILDMQPANGNGIEDNTDDALPQTKV